MIGEGVKVALYRYSAFVALDGKVEPDLPAGVVVATGKASETYSAKATPASNPALIPHLHPRTTRSEAVTKEPSRETPREVDKHLMRREALPGTFQGDSAGGPGAWLSSANLKERQA